MAYANIMGRTNDQRNLIHRRIAAGVGGFIGGGPVAGIAGFFGGGGGGGGTSAGTIARLAQNASLAALGLPPKGGQSLGTYLRNFVPANLWDQVRGILGVAPSGNGAAGQCEDPQLVFDPVKGFCTFPGSPEGGMGELVKGRYGPAEEPFFETRNIRSCLAGFVLGDDKLCYKKGTISNKQRLWPKGTAPLLTGGQMKAIRVAAGAGAKLERTTKRLQKIGLMKKPAPRRMAPHAHARAATGVISVPE